MFVFLHIKKYQKEVSLQIKDTNNENKSLCRISDEYIENCYEVYRTIKKYVFAKGNYDSGISGNYKELDHANSKTKIEMLSGIYI